MSKKVKYKLTIELYGLPAYSVDKLLEQGLHGHTKERVVEGLLAQHIQDHWEELQARGLSIKGAEEQNYIPIDVVEPEE